MTGYPRGVTILNAVLYFGASLFHTGIVTGARLDGATIPEAILGCVLVAGLLGLIRSARLTYAIVIAGTLFGLAIVIASGAPAVDRWIHVAMLTGLGIGLALILWNRTPTTSATRELRP
jgi:ABC-type Mn2+/Zn2+ transport system permease subunit